MHLLQMLRLPKHIGRALRETNFALLTMTVVGHARRSYETQGVQIQIRGM